MRQLRNELEAAAGRYMDALSRKESIRFGTIKVQIDMKLHDGDPSFVNFSETITHQNKIREVKS